jgi:hypothetical protein
VRLHPPFDQEDGDPVRTLLIAAIVVLFVGLTIVALVAFGAVTR